MRNRFIVLLPAALVLAMWGRLPAQSALTPAEAARHVGEVATVCGTVASATFARSARGQPTFLNLDRAYPHQVFTVVIWGSERLQFDPPPEVAYANRQICVTGRIRTFRGIPEIVVRNPSAIRVIGKPSE